MSDLTQAAIRSRNYRFNKLSPKEKRLTLAKDVIDQITLKKIIPTQGTYFRIIPKNKRGSYSSTYDSLYKKPLQQVVENREAECDVCAIGGLFIALIGRINNCTVGEGLTMGSGQMIEEMKGAFTEGTLRQMEEIFENHSYAVGITAEVNKQLKGKSVEERMRIVMENVIYNGGNFKVDKAWLKRLQG